MTVMILENVPPPLRGEITRWLIEIKAGVFVGNVSPRVREKLWGKVCGNCAGGTCLLVYNCQGEQGYRIDFWGAAARIVTQWEGLQLMTKHP